MRFLVAALLWIAFAIPAQADENMALKVAGNMLLLADWSQTRQIARHPERWHERNPVLGRHPSIRRVDTYFAAVILGVNLLDLAVDNAKASDAMWLGITVIEGYTVHRNYGIGIRVRF